ncbi:MAG: hypothetical protein R3194_04245, partial [Limnobacter sp.]|nr:hypothetical protein [Limnobacter sp.]
AVAKALKIPNPLRDAGVVWVQLQAFCIQNQDEATTVQAWLDLLAQIDLYRKPDRLAALLGEFQLLEPQAGALGGLERLLSAVQDGHFKSGQREYLQAHPELHPAQAVQQFKGDWVKATLQGQQVAGKSG